MKRSIPQPLVTIVTPSYNQAKFLEDTIRSVLIQDYPSIEYIIVDGDSKDGSVEIIKRHQEHLAWWVSEPDHGQAEAINKGFSHARGDIFAWLNSDDMYLPHTIRNIVAVFQKHPDVGLIFGNAISIDQDGCLFHDQIFGDYLFEDLLSFQIICQPAVFFRRELFYEAGSLNPQFQYLLDHHLWLRIARLSGMLHVSDFLAFARYHPGAKNIRMASHFGKDADRILDWIKEQPFYQGLNEQKQKAVSAGVRRFSARYLLDGGLYRQAFIEYSRAIKLHPKTALQEWNRILFSAISLLGGSFLGHLFYRIHRMKAPKSTKILGITHTSQIYSEKNKGSMP